ncbi:hypothetical protein V5799_011230 [Amblyomma americanum]|uniref:CCHC-type domain-containing protein n=1 Tax=Amblyomma americanum TaxID=6943 RepID=A0AAQ4EHJ0_AMBAM
MKTTVFLHCDIAGRPYRIQDFCEPLETAGVLPFVAGIGPFEMSHVWMLKLKTAEAKERLLTEGALEVKKRYCAVIEPNKRELAFRVYWVPFYGSNESAQKAFEDFGDVTDVTREQWNSPGFEDAESTTRLLLMVLKEGLSIDDLPHMLKLDGGKVLVVVPGRPPTCLRCKRTGHIRRDCRTPRCSFCRSFGHEQEGCVRTYARVATGAAPPQDDGSELLMDQKELENSGAPPPSGLSDGPAFQQPELPTGNEKSQGDPAAETTGKKADAAAPPEEPMREGTSGDHDSEAPMDATVASIKRPRDFEKAPATDRELRRLERHWRGEGAKKGKLALSRSSSLTCDERPKQ